MAELRVRKINPFSAELTVPGDKSISHRAVMLAALSNGVCQIEGFLPSEDCRSTVNAMRALGVEIEELNEAGTLLRVHGRSGVLEKPEGPIDCGNSGTTMRLLSGILAAQPFEVELIGDESLSRRPMKRIATPLEKMGAKITGSGERCMAPLNVRGTGKVKAIQYESPVSSAQVKSAIMLAGMSAAGEVRVSEPSISRDHTERMMNYLLVKNIREGNTVSIWGGQKPESRDLVVPGDISSAAFWIVAAAAKPGSRLLVSDVGMNPTRTGILGVLLKMGARINERIDDSGCEPMGTVEVLGNRLTGVEIGGDDIPSLIDEIPIIAVAAAMAEGSTVIRDAKELRVKESDRISAVADGLRRMGVPVEEFADGMEITGMSRMKGAVINSLGDHRVAMSFAVAGLYADEEVIIREADCIDTSYPGFIPELRALMKNG